LAFKHFDFNWHLDFDIWNLLRQLQKSRKGDVLYKIMRRTIYRKNPDKSGFFLLLGMQSAVA
jgi:hypothetical protein